MSEYRENEIIETEEVIDRETAAEIARTNLEIKQGAVNALANVQTEIISGLNENSSPNVACWYKEVYAINVSALKDLVQDNKPEKVAEPSVEKAVLDIKMNFIKSTLELIKSWEFNNAISTEEYFEKSKELFEMLDKAVAEYKALDAQPDDDSIEGTEE